MSRRSRRDPNIHIDFTYYPSQNHDVKVNTAIAAGQAPDLILAFSLNYLTEGSCCRWTTWSPSTTSTYPTFNQGIIRGPGEFSCFWDGTLYCLASNQGGWGIFYNKDMFDAAGIPYPAPWLPMTVEQFADVACRLTDEQNGVWGAAVPPSVLPFALMSARTGGRYGVTGPPTPPGVEPFFDAYGDNTAVLASSDQPEEAKEFVAFLAPGGERIAHETEGSSPIDNTVAEEVDWAQGISGRLDILEVLSHARSADLHPEQVGHVRAVLRRVGVHDRREKAVQQALDDAAAAIQDNLDQAWEAWVEQHA